MTKLLPIVLEAAQVRRGGFRILGPLDLTVGANGLTAIVGPNGAGKTTLLKALYGLERLTEGRLIAASTDPHARRRQSFVFQTPVVLRRSVAQNLAYPLTLTGTSRREISDRVAAWAGRIGLADALDKPAKRLSGGERQKLALARGLITRPEVLFLDEPCTNLDGRSTKAIEALLSSARDGGTRIVMVTHDLAQARRLANDAIFLLAGRIHEEGPAEAFFSEPRTAELAAFLAGDIVE